MSVFVPCLSDVCISTGQVWGQERERECRLYWPMTLKSSLTNTLALTSENYPLYLILLLFTSMFVFVESFLFFGVVVGLFVCVRMPISSSVVMLVSSSTCWL